MAHRCPILRPTSPKSSTFCCTAASSKSAAGTTPSAAANTACAWATARSSGASPYQHLLPSSSEAAAHEVYRAPAPSAISGAPADTKLNGGGGLGRAPFFPCKFLPLSLVSSPRRTSAAAAAADDSAARRRAAAEAASGSAAMRGGNSTFWTKCCGGGASEAMRRTEKAVE